jgi:glycosyltransferase involved in cell wall biosynthesis
MLKKALIIPVYNEEITIAETLLDFHYHIPEAYFYVIDNNSTDKTFEIAGKVYKDKNLKGEILFEKRQGKANAVREAFSLIEADIYIMVDGDNTYKGKDINILMQPIIDGQADMTVGDRHKSGAYKRETLRSFHNFGNSFVRWLINFLFYSKLNDILSGYRVFNRRFIENFPILSSGFELETEITLHSLDKRFRIIEIPIEYTERPEGSYSKINTIKDGVKILSTIYQIFRYFKPIIFFSLVSLAFFICGLLTGLPVVIEFVNTHFISHIPLAILATGLEILAVLAITIGIILDTIVRIHHFDYELHLLQSRKKHNDKI